MAQKSVISGSSEAILGDEHNQGGNLLGPILCWAVVFADIGTSIYYVPGILYLTVGSLAGFFVFLTLSVFVLLTLKYAEVTHRFPQGGGVVTVAAQAMNHWVGALGGMFILVDYFLTAALSCLSGVIYFSVVVPAVGSYTLEITVAVLVALGILNWIGISESAKVSLVGAVIAFLSDIAILITVFTHISVGEFFALVGRMFAGHALTPEGLLIGFAGSFLAFSGLESISQLSPVMRTPRKKVAGRALLLVVFTIGLTSPLLTLFSTTLLSQDVLNSSTLSNQVISLLGGKWGGMVLQTEVAISASALLVFASNTAIIGAYHVFMALSRMEFFPAFILRRNKMRNTPHYSIALATGIPIIILIAVSAHIDLLGDMYAFGLLGAFTLTCLGLDIVRHRERKAARALARRLQATGAVERMNAVNGNQSASDALTLQEAEEVSHAYNGADGGRETSAQGLEPEVIAALATPTRSWRVRLRALWYNVDFWLGVLTTFLVALAWCTNLFEKRLATAFGGSVASIGMLVAYINYARYKRQGVLPVVTTGVEGHLPESVLAVLTANNGRNDAIIRTAIANADGKPVVFLYIGERRPGRIPRMFEVVDPYLEDDKAKEYFGKAENLAQKARIPRRFVYRQSTPNAIARVWQVVHPHDTVLAAENAADIEDINPDRIRYELTSNGKVAHLIKSW